jgi:hypothetical protein
MACLIRVGLSRLTNANSVKSLLFAKTEINFLRPISSKLLRDQDVDAPKKPAPWNYKEKPYNILNYWTDRTTSRLDENSKWLKDQLLQGKQSLQNNLLKN